MMDEPRTGDLVVRLDGQRGAIQFLTRKASLGLRVIHELAGEGSDASVEHQIGQVVLAFFSANSDSTAFQLDDYRRAGKDFAAQLSDRDSKTDDPERDFEDALLLLERFDDSWTMQRLDEVEGLIRAAAANGSVKAESYLSDRWGPKRAVLNRRLSRR
jgi:hypothetical protein